jgi:cell division protein FtsZ
MNEAQRPRLVAVGGNAMPGPIPMPAAMAAQAAAQAEAAQQGFVPGPVALQRQAAGQPGGHAAPAVIEQGAEPAVARQQPVAGAPQPAGSGRAAPPPAPQQARRGGLFADPPRTPVAVAAPTVNTPNPPINGQPLNGTEARRSIFQTVTGRLRNTLSGVGSPPTDPAQPRTEPRMQEAKPEPVRASVRPAASEEMGLDIPAFLRRQSS